MKTTTKRPVKARGVVFGNKVKILREEFGLTQDQLMKKIGLKGTGFMSQVELGKCGMKLETSEKLAKFFNVPHYALIDNELSEEYMKVVRDLYIMIKEKRGLENIPAIEAIIKSAK